MASDTKVVCTRVTVGTNYHLSNHWIASGNGRVSVMVADCH